MGSLRNPIGPLPSSIYWRRRGVALVLLALLALLVVWVFGMGGSGGGDKDQGKGTGGGVGTITPGPSSSGPVNSDRPGGRDEADDGGSGSSDGQNGDEPGGTDDGADTGGTAGGADGGGANGSGGTADGIGSGDGENVPVSSSLPDCMPGAVKLTVRSVKNHKEANTYAPDEKPTFEVIVDNSGSTDCKVDFGRTYASLTVTDADNKHVWSSADCPKGSATALIKVAADSEAKRSVIWDRKRSAPHCAKPSGGTSAKPGTYLVEAKVDKLGKARVSFVLSED